MAEIRTIPEKILASGIKDTSVDAVGKFSKKVIHHNAGAPTTAADTGLGYIAGSIWVDTSNGKLYTCLDATAESAVWANMEGDDINNDPFAGENYGFYIGGYGPSGGADVKSEITRFALSAPHAGSDYGEFAPGGLYGVGCFTDAAKTKGFCGGGYSPPAGPGGGDSIAEVTTFNFTGSPIAMTDVGDLDQATANISMQGQTPSLGILGGGIHYPGGSDAILNVIQTFGTAAPYAATDVSETATPMRHSSTSESPTHVYCGGGATPSQVSNIYRYEKSTTDNSADVGELTASSGAYAGGATDGRNGYGFHIAGQNTPGSEVDVIQKYPFSSPTSGSDVGEYSANRQLGGKQVSGTTEFWTTDNSGNIYKGAFASPADTSDVGEAAITVTYSSATQY